MENIDLSCADERAKRLKQLRNLSNLSREKMCSVDYLNINTYKGWELSRHGGLTKKGAKNVIKRVRDENVVCSVEWLLHGLGTQPFVIPDKVMSKQDSTDEEGIIKEIILFINTHENAVYTQIEDDCLSEYSRGDYIAGIKHVKEDIEKCVNKVCIVETEDGEILSRLVLKDSESNYMLLSTNKSYPSNFSNVKIVSAAPVYRHYKPVLLDSI